MNSRIDPGDVFVSILVLTVVVCLSALATHDYTVASITKSVQQDAVKAGAGKWVAEKETGAPQFEWQQCYRPPLIPDSKGFKPSVLIELEGS